jgi:acetolactate synthase regulatory subunit
MPNNKERAVELLKSKVNKLLDWVFVHSMQTTTPTSKDKNKAKKPYIQQIH